MIRFLKTYLIWLLMLVLPAQALASVAQSSCGPDHHAPLASYPAEHAQEHAHGGGDAGHGMERAHHDAAGESDSGAQFKSSFCSACAACCVGAAAITAIQDWTPPVSNAFLAAASPDPAFTPHIPTGPERPPRSILL